MAITTTTTRCKECLLYYSIRIDDDGSMSQWVRETEGGSWKLMPDETESSIGIADYETKYTCWLCKNEVWR